MSDDMLYLTLSILITIILESLILQDLFLLVKVLKDVDHLIYVVPFELGGHCHIVLEHIQRLVVLSVDLKCTGRLIVATLKSRRAQWGNIICLRDFDDGTCKRKWKQISISLVRWVVRGLFGFLEIRIYLHIWRC